MGKKDIYEMAKPVIEKEERKERKPKKTVNKDSLIIGIVIAVVLALTIGIVAYYFVGINNQVVISYKDGEIQRGEYESVYRYIAPTYAYMGYSTEIIYRFVIDQILMNEIIYEEAVKAGYKLTEEDKKAVDQHLSSEDVLQTLVSQGANVETLKKFFYENCVVTAYLNDKQEKVTTDEMKEFLIALEGETVDLNVYKTSHILFAFTSAMTDSEKAELLKEANTVLAKAKKGEDFAKLAAEYSDDTYTKTDGGKVDMLNNGSLVEEYSKAVLSLKKPGLYSKVVETEYGYHIIKLDSIEKDGRLIYEQDLSNYIESYISDRVSEAFDIYDDDNKEQLEKAKQLALRIDADLGIAHSTVTE